MRAARPAMVRPDTVGAVQPLAAPAGLPAHQGLRALRRALAVLGLTLLAGCADLGYYAQSVGGHWQLMRAARPVRDWLAEPALDPTLRQRLVLSQALRDFAVRELHLPDNASYRRYADLGRDAAVWNVVAAPKDSLTPKTWCFIAVGCVAYRGYFDPAQAQALATTLRAQGWEVYVYGVPAYSTLGWLNWMGGDPLLNTFVNRADADLAGLMFHELAHQVLYVPDDTAFNESFATAVQNLGVARWMAQHASPAEQAAHQARQQRRAAFAELTRQTRAELHEIYTKNKPSGQDETAVATLKNEAFKRFRAAYAQRKAAWGGRGEYDAWVAQANNAAFAALAAYDDWVGAFERLFAREGSDWPRFYDAVRRLAQRPPEQRIKRLTELKNG